MSSQPLSWFPPLVRCFSDRSPLIGQGQVKIGP
jgi:hypothetical protein